MTDIRDALNLGKIINAAGPVNVLARSRQPQVCGQVPAASWVLCFRRSCGSD
jgi:hypothetical protein